MLFADNNRRILEKLYIKNKRVYIGLVLGIFGSAEDAEDILHKAFTELLENRKILAVPPDKREAYVYTYIK